MARTSKGIQMNLYLDTEFNEFKGDLISMALVDEQGRYFYESLGCENPGAWVAEHVMPVIGIEPVSKIVIQHRLQMFLCVYGEVHIIADWPEDIQHFCDLLIIGPGIRIDTPPLTMEIRRDDCPSILPHNALADARGIRDFYEGKK
jgi:hypothetical protein